MKLLRDMIIAELRAQGQMPSWCLTNSAPLKPSDWINARCRPGDVALENPYRYFSRFLAGGGVCGCFIWPIMKPAKTHAELVLMRLRAAVALFAQPWSHARYPVPHRRELPFLRQIGCPSLLMEVIAITNSTDSFVATAPAGVTLPSALLTA